MFYDFDMVINAFLFVFELLWCKEIVGRWRDDVDELRSGSITRQIVTVGIWLITLGIIFWIVGLVWTLIKNIINAVTRKNPHRPRWPPPPLSLQQLNSFPYSMTAGSNSPSPRSF